MSAEKRNAPPVEAESSSVLPEDIATLYSWANLHGIKYRDFSSTRQDFRSKPRPRPVSVETPREAPAVEAGAPVADEVVAAAESEALPTIELAAQVEAPAEPESAAAVEPEIPAKPVSRGPWEEFLDGLDAAATEPIAETPDAAVPVAPAVS